MPHEPLERLQTGQLRARFAAGLSAMYAAEVPAYGTLVEVCAQVNSDYLTRHRRAERLGSLQRVTAERHGAIRVGNPAELAAVADLFAAFGMLPVGYYDLRTAESPIPVVSTAFRPIDANELAHNPFRVFTSMLAIEDRRYFDADLRTRVQTFLARRQLFDPRCSPRRGQSRLTAAAMPTTHRLSSPRRWPRLRCRGNRSRNPGTTSCPGCRRWPLISLESAPHTSTI